MQTLDTKPRILIVDDVPANIKALAGILRDDYKILTSTSGQSALNIVAAQDIDLILLDVVMPEIDGYEVCKRLKADKNSADIPIIFVTSKTEDDDEIRGFELGAVDYITKPIRPTVVKVRVNTHLSLRAAQLALANRNSELVDAQLQLSAQNKTLIEAEKLRKDVENISHHDMKGPLSNIIGFAEVLNSPEDLSNEEIREISARLLNSSYVALRMVTLSLDIFKMEQGLYEIAPEKINALSVLQKISSGFEKTFSSQNISVNILIDNNPVDEESKFYLLGEELLCFSMFSNLIKNAFESSTPSGTVTIKLQDSSMALVAIHNHGVVPLEVRNNFFEKYTSVGKRLGTGLGTYSAKLMAKVQNGTIQMETSEKDGTTITVLLPKVAKFD
jgi:two-component system, sensor histidine kinase and response regulator